MIIHIVQAGETIDTIAALYGVAAEVIIRQNGLVISNNLVIGQSILITFPEQTHTVQQGDTLGSIASMYGVPVIQIYRNNPYLIDRDFIYPGEILAISYNNKIRKVVVNGYANEFIDMVVLEKRLLYLTYLSVFGYRVVEDGGVIEINDEEIIRLAKSYGVAPLLVLTTLSTRGEEDIKAAYTILNSEELMDNLITNLLEIIKRKGYYGINITYQLLSNETLSSYEYFTSKIYERLRSEGYFVVVTISPNQIITESGITFERVDYTKIIPLTDLIIILNYNWGYSLSFPAPVSSIDKTNDFLDNIIPYAPPSKIAIGQPLIGYDWQLPYTIGLTKANSLTVNDVYILANQVGATIEYDPLSQTPFFTYNESTSGIPINHIVWFIDSRSFDALLKLITDRGLNGCGIWNIFNYYPQFWVVINVQYDIENVLESTL